MNSSQELLGGTPFEKMMVASSVSVLQFVPAFAVGLASKMIYTTVYSPTTLSRAVQLKKGFLLDFKRALYATSTYKPTVAFIGGDLLRETTFVVQFDQCRPHLTAMFDKYVLLHEINGTTPVLNAEEVFLRRLYRDMPRVTKDEMYNVSHHGIESGEVVRNLLIKMTMDYFRPKWNAAENSLILMNCCGMSVNDVDLSEL
jgi:hypothetical protein